MQTKHVVIAGLAMLVVSAAAYAGRARHCQRQSDLRGHTGKMKPIDMSMNLLAQDVRDAALAETVVTAPATAWRMWSSTYPRSAERRGSFQRCDLHAEGLPVHPHLLALQVNQDSRSTTRNQTSHNIIRCRS